MISTAWFCLARHRHPRQSQRGQYLHRGHRETTGTEDSLFGGNSLQAWLDQCRQAT